MPDPNYPISRAPGVPAWSLGIGGHPYPRRVWLHLLTDEEFRNVTNWIKDFATDYAAEAAYREDDSE